DFSTSPVERWEVRGEGASYVGATHASPSPLRSMHPPTPQRAARGGGNMNLETLMPAPNALAPVLDPRALAGTLSGNLLIDGALIAARSAKSFAVVNPATGEIVAQAALGEKPDVDAAVAAAVKAQGPWARMVARERGKLLAECGRRLNEHVEELGRLVALETGKALRTESRVEASVLADVFVYYGGLASELKGESVPFNPDMLTVTLREPIGVVGAIIPWNVPLMLMALK